MSFVHLRRLLTFPSLALSEKACVLKRFMTINLFHLIYLLIPLSPSQDTHSSGNAGGGPINFYDYLFSLQRDKSRRNFMICQSLIVNYQLFNDYLEAFAVN